MKCGFSNHISMESWPKLITHDIEMFFLRNPHFIFCSSFPNLRLGSIKLKWGFRRKHFSRSMSRRDEREFSIWVANIDRSFKNPHCFNIHRHCLFFIGCPHLRFSCTFFTDERPWIFSPYRSGGIVATPTPTHAIKSAFRNLERKTSLDWRLWHACV